MKVEVGKKYLYVPNSAKEKQEYLTIEKIGRKYAYFIESKDKYLELERNTVYIKGWGYRGNLFYNQKHFDLVREEKLWLFDLHNRYSHKDYNFKKDYMEQMILKYEALLDIENKGGE